MMKIFILLLLFSLTSAFTPIGTTTTEQHSVHSSSLQYTRAGEIAHELEELTPIPKRKTTHLASTNPWKPLLTKELDRAKLQHHIYKDKIAEQEKVQFLEDKLYSLYTIASILAAEEIYLTQDIKELQEERNSIWKMSERIVRLFGLRLKRGVKRVAKFLRLV
jgi:glutathionylspermidine synthase